MHSVSKPKLAFTARRFQSGISLLENLIALVILSIGLLGHANLQNLGLRTNTQAYWRTQASILAIDMADRMRANPAGIAAGGYNDVSTLPDDADCIKTFCTPLAMAQTDSRVWQQTLARELPQGSGSVTGRGVGSLFTIKIRWLETEADGATTKEFTMAVMP